MSGAVAFYFPGEPFRVAVEDMPVAGKMVSAPLLTDMIRKYGPTIAIVESVGSRPGQGVVSTFKFGTAYGVVQGVIGALQIPVEFVSPQRWKKHFHLNGDKEQARAKAQQLFPVCAASFQRVKDHGRAEAALIARYGFETLFPASAAA
jgi:crossover junction endodeoxyribonuclease RuvC